MATTIKCTSCDGRGVREYLVSMHDYETEYGTCNRCNGKGVIHYMSDEDEEDYYNDYW